MKGFYLRRHHRRCRSCSRATSLGNSRGESIELAFPEHGFSIECQPRGDVVDCTLVRYGETHGSELYVCTRDDVTSAVRGLAEAVLRDSVTFGYLEQADATAFLV